LQSSDVRGACEYACAAAQNLRVRAHAGADLVLEIGDADDEALLDRAAQRLFRVAPDGERDDQPEQKRGRGCKHP
jgi:hypothetical protein